MRLQTASGERDALPAEIPAPAAPSVPSTITPVQFWLLAEDMGYDEAAALALIDVNAAAEGWTEAERRGLAVRLRKALEFPRDFPALEVLVADADPPLTPAQLDDLYRYGATL